MASTAIYAKLVKVSARIKQLERERLSKIERYRLADWQWATIYPPKSKRTSVYRSTPPAVLYEDMKLMIRAKKLDLKKLHAADLGSGICASSIALSYFFKTVTAFELYRRFANKGRSVCREFGYKNIIVKQKDYVAADLKKFNFLYLFYPFMENFDNITLDICLKALPGTLIASRTTIPLNLMAPKDIQMFYPEDPEVFNHCDFHVFRRV